MMKKAALFLWAMAFFGMSYGQGTRISGLVMDSETGETLIGANVLYEESAGTITDVEGKFELRLEPGTYTFRVSYVGFESESREIKVEDKAQILEFRLSSLTIDEVVIVADIARTRETPVAFSNVSPARIEEELAGQDFPILLNSTPGVYATQQGGGDGDARITIRGFDQTNLAVMIDGIPVNDMENGWVYWSNWFGLDAVTRTMQVQRGLGASQLALPSVGGTINILTSGIDSKAQTSIKQEVDSQGKLRTSFGFTSGKLKNGWGVTLAGSYKRGNGWVDNTFSEGWFYYGKIEKRTGKHLVTLTAMGAPQRHDQRSYKLPISSYDTTYAKKLGVDINMLDSAFSYSVFDRGVQYNQHWGTLSRNRDNPDAEREILSERTNEYHKPQFTIRDFWTVNERLNISSNLYMSIGKGGGDSPFTSIKNSQIIQDPASEEYGQIDWQRIYDSNWKGTPPFYSPPIVPSYSDSLFNSKNYMVRRHNEHNWYGLLTKLSYRLNQQINFSGGLDLRSYKGIHFATIRDLLGGDYAIDKNDMRINYQAEPLRAMKFVGDTIDYYYEGLVRWGGIFAQGEYTTRRLSAFVNLTTAASGYNKVDYFEQAESGWKYKQGFTVKTGLNFNIDERSNVFLNLGYLSRVKAYKYFYQGYTTRWAQDLKNELIKAVEAGYTYGSPRISVFTNLYYTRWENKPTENVTAEVLLIPGDPGYSEGDDESHKVYAQIPGMAARHMGLEVDAIYKIRHNLELQGTVSIGDWIWDSRVDSVQYYLSEGDFRDEPVGETFNFDARGIHVGDAAQVQLGSSLRWEPFKGFYLNLRQTYFAKYYSSFTPEATTDENGKVHDSWKMPDFNLFDLHTGYSFKLQQNGDIWMNVRFSLLNALNTTYIWDARNNDSYSPYSSMQNFDAASATVFFGMGRRFSASLRITF